MQSIKAHFDGHAIILDEPADLVIGQSVRVLVDPIATGSPERKSSSPGPWAGKFRVVRDCDEVIADDFKDYMP